MRSFFRGGDLGCFLAVVCGLSLWCLLVAEHGLWSLRASVVVVHGLSCPVACGIFLAQGLNPRPLSWQADS